MGISGEERVKQQIEILYQYVKTRSDKGLGSPIEILYAFCQTKMGISEKKANDWIKGLVILRKIKETERGFIVN